MIRAHTISRSKAVLLDVDGVVFHHPRVMTRIVHRASQFVHKEVPGITHILDASNFNRVLYKNFGHTQLGIRHILGVKAPSLCEFNAWVYDASTLAYLRYYKDYPEVVDRLKSLHEFLYTMKVRNIPCYLFSNAPLEWCQEVYDIMQLGDLIAPTHVLSSSHEAFEGTLLKPERRLYDNVQEIIDAQELFLVDDSIMNLIPIFHDKRWRPILFGSGCSKVETDAFTVAHTFNDIKNIIH